MHDKRTTPVRAVTFDFWNTIAVERLEAIASKRGALLADYLSACQCDLPFERSIELIRACSTLQRKKWADGEIFSSSAGSRWIMSQIKTMLPSDAENSIRGILEHLFTPEELVISPYLDETLAFLHSRSIRIGLICDTGFTPGHILCSRLRALDLMRWFTGTSFSDEVGYFKPDKQIFFHALGYLECAPHEAWHVGDIFRTDIMGARMAGLVPVRYKQHNDDPGTPDADFVINDFRDLQSLVSANVK